jgi:hypothetical protein
MCSGLRVAKPKTSTAAPTPISVMPARTPIRRRGKSLRDTVLASVVVTSRGSTRLLPQRSCSLAWSAASGTSPGPPAS